LPRRPDPVCTELGACETGPYTLGSAVWPSQQQGQREVDRACIDCRLFSTRSSVNPPPARPAVRPSCQLGVYVHQPPTRLRLSACLLVHPPIVRQPRVSAHSIARDQPTHQRICAAVRQLICRPVRQPVCASFLLNVSVQTPARLCALSCPLAYARPVRSPARSSAHVHAQPICPLLACTPHLCIPCQHSFRPPRLPAPQPLR
jgi:hypothetical protein